MDVSIGFAGRHKEIILTYERNGSSDLSDRTSTGHEVYDPPLEWNYISDWYSPHNWM